MKNVTDHLKLCCVFDHSTVNRIKELKNDSSVMWKVFIKEDPKIIDKRVKSFCFNFILISKTNKNIYQQLCHTIYHLYPRYPEIKEFVKKSANSILTYSFKMLKLEWRLMDILLFGYFFVSQTFACKT